MKLDTVIVETYLKSLWEIRATRAATPETSYYGALEALINNVASANKHPSRCIIELADSGHGRPDGGIFKKQPKKEFTLEIPLGGIKPEYGAIEVKPVSHDIIKTAKSGQVTRYWVNYRKVLVTNLREFVLVDDFEGKMQIVDTFALSNSEAGFWEACKHSRKTAKEKGRLLIEFLMRTILHEAKIVEPRDLALYLASYARDALSGLLESPEKEVASIRQAMESVLSMNFFGPKGDHFFRSSIIQTLFYGVFSAFVLWSRSARTQETDEKFEWKSANYYLNIPILEKLYAAVAQKGKLEGLNLLDTLDRVGEILNRVSRRDFFQKFSSEEAVQYFYEPFLEAYDPELRKEYGVWYTPPEIVQYMVERVDRVLRTELGIAKGLADESVYVLDPCCGTGAFLVEVIRRIGKTLKEGSASALAAEKIKKAATERIFGFEILLAPLVISHMQINLELEAQGSKLFQESRIKPAVYLTNALTDWGPPPDIGKDKEHQTLIHEFDEERKAASEVKREKPILVVIGNPPYNAFAGVSPKEEEGLVEIYKGPYIEGSKDMFGNSIPKSHKQRKYWLNTPESEGGWGIKKFNLDELYVRFFRIAERRVAEMTEKGIVCFISNYSWTEEPSFVIMREHFLKSFDRIWIENMHGNRKITEYAPDGRTSQTIFAIRGHSPGIRQGVVISLSLKSGKDYGGSNVLYRNNIDDANADVRRTNLLKSLKVKDPQKFDAEYEPALPSKDNKYSFRPLNISEKYKSWPKVTDICIAVYNGPVERRGMALMSFDAPTLVHRIKLYFNPKISNEQVASLHPKLMMTGNRINGDKARQKLLNDAIFDANNIVQYPVKPFDVRWCYLANIRPLFSEPSPELLAQSKITNNAYFVTRDSADKDPEGAPVMFSRLICDYSTLAGPARLVPMFLKANGSEAVPNLSDSSVNYLKKLGIGITQSNLEDARKIWLHALAIGYSPEYLSENADGIRQDWPRIPLPDSAQLLDNSTSIGETIAAALDTEKELSLGDLAAADWMFDTIGVLTHVRAGIKNLREADGHFELTAGWGYKSKGRDDIEIVMPGIGRIVKRDYDERELAAIEEASLKKESRRKEIITLLGEQTCDVFLNDDVYWKNIPARVWEFYIGGYQVIKKWLSYREMSVLGRSLFVNEAEYIRDVARKLAFLRLKEPKLDQNYRAVKENAFDWASLD